MDVRDSLLKAAEKRIEMRLQELKELEARLNGAATKKDEAEAAKFKSLVSMYETMKAKDAAKIFDRLNLRILVEVVNVMNRAGCRTSWARCRRTSPNASPSRSRTVPARVDKAPQPVELPKIEGRPSRS